MVNLDVGVDVGAPGVGDELVAGEDVGAPVAADEPGVDGAGVHHGVAWPPPVLRGGELPAERDVEAATLVIRDVMATAAAPLVELHVPLDVEIGTGKSWGAAH